jgi:hypothetical protein
MSAVASLTFTGLPIAGFEPTSLIVVAVFLFTILGVAYGLKTRKGSGINEHPGAESLDPARDPNVAGPGTQPESERADSTLLDQHGKQ